MKKKDFEYYSPLIDKNITIFPHLTFSLLKEIFEKATESNEKSCINVCLRN